MDVTRIETEDGSATLRDDATGLTFRSTHGARAESRHVFVEMAVRCQIRNHAGVFELGFGGAMNFCETALAFREREWNLHYVAVERDPVDPEVLTHPDAASLELARAALSRPGVPVRRNRCELTVHVADERDFDGGGFDAVYHDPFSPKDAPECWTADVFRRHAERLEGIGLLATYSAATAVRESMVEAGLVVASRPGPGRKREVTVASESDYGLHGFDIVGRPDPPGT